MVGFGSKSNGFNIKVYPCYSENNEINIIETTDISLSQGENLYYYIDLRHIEDYEQLHEFKIDFNYFLNSSFACTLQINSFTCVEAMSLVQIPIERGEKEDSEFTIELTQSSNLAQLDITNYVKQKIASGDYILKLRLYLYNPTVSNVSVDIKNAINIFSGSFITDQPLLQKVDIFNDETAVLDYSNEKLLFNLKALPFNYKGISIVNNPYLLFNKNLSIMDYKLVNFNYTFDLDYLDKGRIIMYDSIGNKHLFYSMDKSNSLFKCFENNWYFQYPIDVDEKEFLLSINGVNYKINKQSNKISGVTKNDIILLFQYDESDRLTTILEFIPNNFDTQVNFIKIVEFTYSNNRISQIKDIYNKKLTSLVYENDYLSRYFISDYDNETNKQFIIYEQDFCFNNGILSSITYDYVNKFNFSISNQNDIYTLIVENDQTKDKLFYSKNNNYLKVCDSYNNINKNFFDNKNNIIYFEALNSNNKIVSKSCISSTYKNPKSKDLLVNNLLDEDAFINSLNSNSYITVINDISLLLTNSSLSNYIYRFNLETNLYERKIVYPMNIQGKAGEVLSLSCLGKLDVYNDLDYFEIGLNIYYDLPYPKNIINENGEEEQTKYDCVYYKINFDKTNHDFQFQELQVPISSTFSKIDLCIKYYGKNYATLSNIFINKIPNQGKAIYDENNQITGYSTISESVFYDYKHNKDDETDSYFTKSDNGKFEERRMTKGNVSYIENYCNNDKTSYEYNSNNLLSKKTTTKNNFKSVEQYYYDSNDKLESKSIDDKKEYYYNTNIDYLSIKQTIHPNGILNKQITDYGSVSRNFTQIYQLDDLEEKNKFYYKNGLLSYIENFDNKIYKFKYDDKQRISSIYFDDVLYMSYEYDDKGLVTFKKYNNDNYYTFDYDENGRLVNVYHCNYSDGTHPIFTYEYDDFDRIKTIKDMDTETQYSFEYDECGNIIKQNNKNIKINYDYNDNNIVSKNNIIKNEQKVYNYSYSQYEDKVENIFSLLTNNIYSDYLFPTKNNSFVFSEKIDFSNTLLYDKNLKRNVYNITLPEKVLLFDVNKINQRKEDGIYKDKVFKVYDYDINVFKTISSLVFIKPSSQGKLNSILKLIQYYPENEIQVSLEVSSTNELILNKYENETLITQKHTNLYINLDKYNIIGLSCEHGNEYDNISIVLNNTLYNTILPATTRYEWIQLLDNSCEDVEVAFLTAGYKVFNEEEVSLLYNDFDLVFNYNKNNQIIYNTNYEVFDSSELDKVTLNKSFKTIKGNEPKLLYTKDDYSNALDRFFKYDKSINKYCYISNKYKNSYLKYNLNCDLSKNLYINTNLKPLLKKPGVSYTLFAINEISNDGLSNNEVLKVYYRHPQIYLSHSSLTEPISAFLPLYFDKFNTFSFYMNEDNIVININGKEQTFNKFTFSTTNLELIIGNDNSNNAFCGLISDFVFGFVTSNDYINKTTNFINILDGEGRLRNKVIKTNIDSNEYTLSTTYSYYDNKYENDSDYQKFKDQIHRIKNYDGTEEIISYNDNNSIIKRVLIKDDKVSKVINYEYDSFNRLIKEQRYDINKDNVIINSYLSEYQYDNFGNIIKNKQWENNELVTNKTYTYENDNTNRLISVNDEVENIFTELSYNNTLYPTKIGNNTLNYEGNKLSNYNNIYFIYDSLGKRIKKINTDDYYDMVEYIYDNDNLVRQIKGNIVIEYIYNNSLLEGLRYNGEEYYYIRDITGCIEKIIDKYQNVMVLYKYNSYGEVDAEVGSSLNENKLEIANILKDNNGFVYKGYYYDVETQLYWVSSRYYSPELCRWISPDSIEYLDPQSINGLNLYAYCGNDPINKYDPTGHSAILAMVLIGTLFGAAVGFGFDAGKQLINNGWDFSEVDWGSAVNSAIVGGALGFSLAMGVGYLGPVIAGTATAGGLTAGGAFAISTAVSFGAGALGYATEEWMNGRTPSFGKAMMHGGFVALEGMVNFGVGGIVGSLGNVGTKGKFLTSKEWWGKFIFGLEFTQPFKILIDYIRKNI